MKEKSVLDEHYLLWILINQTRKAVFKARGKYIGDFNYPVQAAALINIWANNGKATPTMLSRYLFLERHSASELISRMEENGLVTKKRDEKMKSVVRISITPKGEKTCAYYMYSDFIHEMVSPLTDEEREVTIRSLRKILNQACEKLGTQAILPPLE